jgi:hypothetical protein
MVSIITTPDQDIDYQYSDGRDLLSAALIERHQLLRELENLVVAPLEPRTDGGITRFEITRGQTLLYELSFVTERIDTLILLINGYAEKCGKPRVEITETKPK